MFVISDYMFWQSIPTAADVDTGDILQVRAVHALSALFTLLSKKENSVDPEIYLIEDYPVSNDYVILNLHVQGFIA